jgi:predicted KAP-like P-loop ATPase
MFKPDRPIEKTAEDLLGRVDFSESFAKALLAYNEDDSIVTALYGDWGAGKSSVINMTLECVGSLTHELESDKKPIVVKFNPWNYSDQSHLVALSFKELSFALRREDYGSQAKEIGEKLEAYSNFFTPLALIPDPSISVTSLLTQKVFKGVGTAAKAWGAAYSKDIDATRKELDSLLKQQERKILIIIDDIDRLANLEIRQIFQLVKMLGDFSNTLYLLAFDRGVVVNALSKVQEGDGNEYLEKIVQFPIELPPINSSDLEKLLFVLLDELIKEIPEGKWDGTYWGNIYHSGMKYYFTTIRDVTRYINTLKFSFEMVRDDVNPVDFIAMTSLQVFEPELYAGIRDNKDLFAGTFNDRLNSYDSQLKQCKARIDEILSRSSSDDLSKLTDFLERIFPRLGSVYGGTSYGNDWMASWRLASRVCHPDLFDVYFMLALPSGEVPKGEIESVLSLADNKEAFTLALQNLVEDKKILRYLELMEDYTDEGIPEDLIPNIVTVLMDIGDTFPDSKSGRFDFGTPMKLLRIIKQLSMRYDSQEERYQLIRAAILEARGSIYTLVYKVALLDQEHGRFNTKTEEPKKPESELEVSTIQLDDLEEITLKIVEDWATSGRLVGHRHLISILYSWRRWTGEGGDAAKIYVDDLISDDVRLIEFVTSFAGQSSSQAMGDYVSVKNWRMSLKSIGDFCDVETVNNRLRKLYSSEEFKALDQELQNGVQVFLDSYDGKLED